MTLLSTVTATPIPSDTPQPPLPATPANDAFAKVLKVVPVPNPDPTGLAIELRGRAKELHIQFYGVSLRCLAHVHLRSQGPGWISVPLPAEFTQDASNGAYYARVWTDDPRRSVIARFVQLK